MSNEVGNNMNPRTRAILDSAGDVGNGDPITQAAHGGMEKMMQGGLKIGGMIAGLLGGVLGSCGGGCGGI